MKTETEIKALLEKYFDGLTSLDEESELRGFFAAQPRPPGPGLELPAAMFDYFGRQAQVMPPAVRRVRRAPRKWLIAAAAVAALAVVVPLALPSEREKSQAVACIDGRRTTDRDEILAEYDRIMHRRILSEAGQAIGKLNGVSKAGKPLAKLSAINKNTIKTTEP